MLGPAANHYVTVSHPHNFHWREGSFGDLIPLLGDGLLTIDAGYHDRARRIMMPAFHHEQIEASVEAMVGETEAAIARSGPGRVVDVYAWSRKLAMRIAMRALLGLDPDDGGRGAAAAEHFERALGYYGTDYHMRMLRGPRSPWHRLISSREVLDEIVYAEIAERRARSGSRAAATSSACCSPPATRTAPALSDGEVRDQLMTLMFAGHDTSTSTLSFLLYELARHPGGARPPAGRAGRGARRRAPDAGAALQRAALPRHGRGRGPAPLPARLGRARAARSATSSSPGTPSPPAPTSTTAPGPATGSPRSSPSPRRSSPSASRASARRRCRAAPTCRSAAARGSASASASARPRSSWWRRCCFSGCASSCCPAGR